MKRINLESNPFPLTVRAVEDAVVQGVAPGVVAGFWRAAEPDRFFALARGHRRLEPSPQTLSIETPFDLASLTKVLATAPLVALLVDRGWWSWDTDVTRYFPTLSHWKGIQIRHLMSHTAGFCSWKPFWHELQNGAQRKYPHKKLEQVPIAERQLWMRELVFSVQPDVAPGTRVEYSDLSFLILQFLIEEALQMSLVDAVESYVWGPLGMTQTHFGAVTQSVAEAAQDLKLQNIAATEKCSWRGGVIQGQVHDDNTWAMGGYAGHAGAFGPLEDLFRFVRGMVGGFLSHSILQQMWEPVGFLPGCTRTLGWDTPSLDGPSSLGNLFSRRSVGHLGFTGVSLWIDLDQGIAAGLLTNRVHPSRENQKIREFRPRFHDALAEDLKTH